MEAVLRERKLGPLNNRRSDGMKFRLQCPTSNGRPGCAGEEETELEGRCCARALMAAQKDFREQKGRLEEELNAVNHLTIFYPKFHCELNFIERFWCSPKWYARFEGLRVRIWSALGSALVVTENGKGIFISKMAMELIRKLDIRSQKSKDMRA